MLNKIRVLIKIFSHYQAIKKFCSKNNPVLASVSGPYKKRDVRIKKIDSDGDLINYTNSSYKTLSSLFDLSGSINLNSPFKDL